MFTDLIPALADEVARCACDTSRSNRCIMIQLDHRATTAAFTNLSETSPLPCGIIPPGRLVGYDNEASAECWPRSVCGSYRRLSGCCFGLQKLLPGAPVMFDFGGNVGYQLLRLQESICSTQPCGVVGNGPFGGSGRRRADFRAESRRNSCASRPVWTGLRRPDILLAAGSLHFLSVLSSFSPQYRRCRSTCCSTRCRYGPCRQQWTLPQHGRRPVSLSPVQSWLNSGGFRSLGFTLRDEWINPDLGAASPCMRTFRGRVFGLLLERRRRS